MLVRGLHTNICGFGRGRQGLSLLYTVVLRQLVCIQGVAVVGKATDLVKSKKQSDEKQTPRALVPVGPLIEGSTS